MNLRDLLHGVTAQPIAAVPVAGIACHSKHVRSGDVFVAIDGTTSDGHAFIEEALSRGACAVVAQRLPSAISRPAPCVVVRDSRQALVVMAQRFYGRPSRKLRLIGVTGTNGKTTTTYLIKAILDSAGARAGMLGTIVYQIGGRALPSTNTTPGPLELQRYFAQMVGEGLKWCAMEVSSHALAQGRIEGLEFEGAIFTNLGSDHLDYHKTRDAYAAAKRRLFDYLRPDGWAVINTDDEDGQVLAHTLPHGRVVSVGMEQPAKVSMRHVACTWEGTSFILESPWGVVPVTTPLLGRHNVWNIAQASAVLLALGVKPMAIHDGLAAVDTVPGRLERVPNDAGLQIVIDYAHTADALRLVLLSLRELSRGRVIVVFGCGGDRDQTKRPVMGKMASLLADYVILTSDNPRTEEPIDIIHQIKRGFHEGFKAFDVIPDREQAIVSALSVAHRDDTVLIAGKGHEAYQVFDHISVPFSDREVVERWAGARHQVAVA
ncbi:MAG: UDP-N-acetylmuramoyl-L-alanyl-D-glutamate--2,6-diaminopimelate ligase [Candidatus Omnitrophica bacterium]|nr:UDP-N-acetylmuramoyl-L-alanyl-D-glutamate--2,6-diaminopimelate ligase [Candidatus Omnitrophota bacterium]